MSRASTPALIRLTCAPGARARWQCDLGHAVLRADRAWPGFVAAPPADEDEVEADRRFATVDVSADAGVSRQAEGWLGDAVRTVVSTTHEHLTQHAARDFGAVRVADDGARVALDDQAAASALAGEWLLGVGLVQALARRGWFCLHACAGEREGRVIAIAGASGGGKSTLARAMARDPRGSRLTDDILPWHAATARAWPRCPQLKLAPEAWARVDDLAVDALFVLVDRGDAARVTSRWSTSEARRAVIAATAGARLFDAPLLQRHLDACTRFAERVPVHGLHVRDAAADADGAAQEALDVMHTVIGARA